MADPVRPRAAEPRVQAEQQGEPVIAALATTTGIQAAVEVHLLPPGHRADHDQQADRSARTRSDRPATASVSRGWLGAAGGSGCPRPEHRLTSRTSRTSPTNQMPIARAARAPPVPTSHCQNPHCQRTHEVIEWWSGRAVPPTASSIISLRSRQRRRSLIVFTRLVHGGSSRMRGCHHRRTAHGVTRGSHERPYQRDGCAARPPAAVASAPVCAGALPRRTGHRSDAGRTRAGSLRGKWEVR